jgi:hypothetical protein
VLVSGFCGDAVCHGRIQIWLLIPDDAGISDPCEQCLDMLAALFAVRPEGRPTLSSLWAPVKARL